MTVLLLIILFIFISAILISNLHPKIQLKYPWFLTTPIYLTGIISYIMLLWMILLKNRDLQLNAAYSWIPFDLNIIWLEFKIDNQTILLLTLISTVFIFKHIFLQNRLGRISSESKLHYANSTNALLLAGFIALISDSLLVTAVAQIILSLTLYYRCLELNRDADNQSSGSIHYIWLIFFDLLFIMALMLIFAETKLLTIATLAQLNLNGSNSSPLFQTARFLLILSIFGKGAQVPFHKWLIAGSSMDKSAPEKSFSLESLIIIMSILYKLGPLLDSDCLLFLMVIGFLGTLLALWAAIIHKDQESIFNYLLIAQAGLFFIIFGAGFYSLLLIYIIIFSWSNLLLRLSIISNNQSFGKGTGYFIISTSLIAVLAIIGFPLTAALTSKIIIFQNLISQAQLNPVSWVTLVLFSLAHILLILNLFRLFFIGMLNRSSSSLSYPTRLPLAQMSIFIILVMLNVYLLYSIPDFNPFTTNSWLDRFLTLPLQSNPDITVNPIGVVGIILLFQSLSLLIVLLIYHFELIDASRLRFKFRGVEKFVRSLTDPNPVAIQKLALVIDQIAAKIHKFEDQLINQFACSIATSLDHTREKFIKFNNRFVEASPSEKIVPRKLLSRLICFLKNRELLFFLIVMTILIIIIILSIF